MSNLSKILQSILRRVRPGFLLDVAMDVNMTSEEVKQTLEKYIDIPQEINHTTILPAIEVDDSSWVIGVQDEGQSIFYKFSNKKDALDFAAKIIYQFFVDNDDWSDRDNIWRYLDDGDIESAVVEYNYIIENYDSAKKICLYEEAKELFPELIATFDDCKKIMKEYEEDEEEEDEEEEEN